MLRSRFQPQSYARPGEDLDFLGQYSDKSTYNRNRDALYRDSPKVEEVEEAEARPMTPHQLARYHHNQARRRGRFYLV
jgi:hypothetical protein